MSTNSKTAWLLRLEGSQFGPFSESEVVRIIHSKTLVGSLYASRVGSKHWFLLTDVNQIVHDGDTNWDGVGHVTRDSLISKRKHVRISLVATVSKILPDQKLLIGVCSDVSVGGMQVLNSAGVKFIVGEELELAVNPIVAAGIEPFTISATVAWVKLGLKKVGFEFVRFDVNYALQKYIEANKHGLEFFS